MNDPSDSGGETYKDIARKSNPSWQGWQIIDEIKKDHKPKWNECFDRPDLDALHYEYSKQKFWDEKGFAKIASQAVANVIFEFMWGSGGVGLKTAIEVLNAMTGEKFTKWNYNAIAAINKLNAASYIANMLAARKRFYEALAAKRPKDQKFLKGWLNRLNALAKYVGGNVIETVQQHKVEFAGAGLLALLGLGIYLYGRK